MTAVASGATLDGILLSHISKKTIATRDQLVPTTKGAVTASDTVNIFAVSARVSVATHRRAHLRSPTCTRSFALVFIGAPLRASHCLLNSSP